MDENLIEFVRNHEELYSYEDKRYFDNVHKNKLWEELGNQLNNKGSDYCKKRWESLRSQYRKICRLHKTQTGEATKKTKKWKYEDEMSFLLPHMKDKERLRKKCIPPSDTARSTSVKYIPDQKAAQTSKPQDALDHFFDGIKSTVKSFSPMDQHMAKIKIFNVVSQIEAKYVCGINSQLLPQNQTSDPCNAQQFNIPSGFSSYSSDSTSPINNPA